jgi:hypothetical protein
MEARVQLVSLAQLALMDQLVLLVLPEDKEFKDLLVIPAQQVRLAR